LEHGAEGGLDGRFVVDDQDVLARHLQASTGAGARVTGTSMTKRVPEGWLSSTRMVPPCSLTISLTIGSPRPMPVTLVEKYGRKRRSRSSLGTPGPVSATINRTRAASGTYSVSSDTVPPEPTASTALSTRLRTARLMWSGSTWSTGTSSAWRVTIVQCGCDSR